MPLGPNPNPGLGSQDSVPRGLTLKPSRLGTPEPYCRILPSTQKETVPLGVVGYTQIRRNLHPHLKPPSPSALPSAIKSQSYRLSAHVMSTLTLGSLPLWGAPGSHVGPP